MIKYIVVLDCDAFRFSYPGYTLEEVVGAFMRNIRINQHWERAQAYRIEKNGARRFIGTLLGLYCFDPVMGRFIRNILIDIQSAVIDWQKEGF
jgi:hypothetical protein